MRITTILLLAILVMLFFFGCIQEDTNNSSGDVDPTTGGDIDSTLDGEVDSTWVEDNGMAIGDMVVGDEDLIESETNSNWVNETSEIYVGEMI